MDPSDVAACCDERATCESFTCDTSTHIPVLSQVNRIAQEPLVTRLQMWIIVVMGKHAMHIHVIHQHMFPNFLQPIFYAKVNIVI